MDDVSKRLQLAKNELAKAQVGAFEPVDWLEVALFAFYALENAVCAAADFHGVSWKRDHPSKVAAAEALHRSHDLPDVQQLLIDLNELRKSESYGEVRPPVDRTAEDVVADVEAYLVAVETHMRDEP